MELNLSPSPVSVTTPTMMPAEAQVMATVSTPIDPPSSDLTNPDLQKPFIHGMRPRNQSYETSAVSLWKNDSTNVTTVAQNTDSTGE